MQANKRKYLILKSCFKLYYFFNIIWLFVSSLNSFYITIIKKNFRFDCRFCLSHVSTIWQNIIFKIMILFIDYYNNNIPSDIFIFNKLTENYYLLHTNR